MNGGRVNVIFERSGTQGFEDLARSAITFQAFGVEVRAASLEDILPARL